VCNCVDCRQHVWFLPESRCQYKFQPAPVAQERYSTITTHWALSIGRPEPRSTARTVISESTATCHSWYWQDNNADCFLHCYDCGIHCRNLGPTVFSFVIGCFNQLLHPFNGLFSTTTWVSRHQKGKPLWILLEQEMMGWQWHQLDHIQIICTLLQTDNHASTSPLSFCRPDALPAAQPTASKHWRHRLFQLNS